MNTGHAWELTVEVPYDSHWSKNRSTGRAIVGGKMRSFPKAEAKAHRTRLRDAIEEALIAFKITPRIDKLLVRIFVVRDSMRGDVANVADLVLDACKDALDLDDRWYSVGVDWTMNTRLKPFMAVTISQMEDRGVSCCIACGEYKSHSGFAPYKAGPFGHKWTCRACDRAKARAKRAAQESASA